MFTAITEATIGGIWPFGGPPLMVSIAFSTEDRLVSASCWPCASAVMNALRVPGFWAAQDFVTTYPWMGNCSVAPWLRSASSTAPYCCSAAVANGSRKRGAPAFLLLGSVLFGV